MSEPLREFADPNLATDRSPELIRHTLNVDYTGLPYATPEVRHYLIDMIDSARGKGLAVAFIDADLNELKPINDKLGHQKGNEAITFWANQVRERIVGLSAADVFFYRPQAGGDELKALLILSTKEKDKIAKVFSLIQQTLVGTTNFEGWELTASYGIESNDLESSVDPAKILQDLELKAEDGKDSMKLGRIIRKVDNTIKSGRRLSLPEYIKVIEDEWYERRMPRNVINRIIEHCLAKRIIMDLSPQGPADYED